MSTLAATGLQSFLAMGGYGGYVWGSFGITAAAVAWELVGLRRRRLAWRFQAAGLAGAAARRVVPGARSGAEGGTSQPALPTAHPGEPAA